MSVQHSKFLNILQYNVGKKYGVAKALLDDTEVQKNFSVIAL
jgi:hypothetical protein